MNNDSAALPSVHRGKNRAANINQRTQGRKPARGGDRSGTWGWNLVDRRLRNAPGGKQISEPDTRPA